LDDKLATVQHFLTVSKPTQAEENLQTFMQQVEAQRGKGLTQIQADVLAHVAERLIGEI